MLDLMAIVSHELKSPLAAVQTTAATLQRGYFGKLEPEQQKIVETIIRNCAYLEDIIRSYIDLSKMELDGLNTFKERVPVRFGRRRRGPGHARRPGQRPEDGDRRPSSRATRSSTGDPNLLKIVVGNLVNNAIKYGYEGTPVRLRLGVQERRARLFRPERGRRASRRRTCRALFKRFERLRQKGTEGVKGSGLGLYICKTIVDKHKGRIWAESEPGKWVEFFVVLPASAPH